MAIKDKAALDAAIVTATANIAALIEDNNNGEITEQKVRDAYGNVLSVAQDVIDSSFNLVDDNKPTLIWSGTINTEFTNYSIAREIYSHPDFTIQLTGDGNDVRIRWTSAPAGLDANNFIVSSYIGFPENSSEYRLGLVSGGYPFDYINITIHQFI